ncbi:MAG: nitroreductase family protein [Actinomycetota bacterium]
MELQDVIRKRRMVRAFEDRPVPAAAVERILENAIRAPSAGFSQGWGFLVLDEPDPRATFWRTAWPGDVSDVYDDMRRAPVVILPLANKQAYLDRYAEPDKGWLDKSESHWPVPYWYIDTGFASLLMLLTALDEGLAAVFIGCPQIDAVRAAFGIPEQYTPIGAICIGYGAPDKKSPSLKRGRKGVEVVVHHNRW